MRRLLAMTVLLAPTSVRADVDPAAIRQAVEKGLRRLDAGAGNYVKNRQCFSCHHQATSITAFRAAHRRGIKINDERLREQIAFTLDTFRSKHARVAKGEGVPGASTMAAYALFTLDVAGHPADETTAAIVDYLLVRQKSDGAWPALMSRPPSEGSSFTNNALALRALRKYGSVRKVRSAAAIAKGIEWLRKNQPLTTEDRVFRLRGLVAAGADAREVESACASLAGEQRPDGSWTQLPDRDGDAYATATVLLALREAGLEVAAQSYQRGIGYLLKTQKDDGSWIVQSRSRPVQVFFDNGDPGGKSQFISFAATGWAVTALAEALPLRE